MRRSWASHPSQLPPARASRAPGPREREVQCACAGRSQRHRSTPASSGPRGSHGSRPQRRERRGLLGSQGALASPRATLMPLVRSSRSRNWAGTTRRRGQGALGPLLVVVVVMRPLPLSTPARRSAATAVFRHRPPSAARRRSTQGRSGARKGAQRAGEGEGRGFAFEWVHSQSHPPPRPRLQPPCAVRERARKMQRECLGADRRGKKPPTRAGRRRKRT